MNDSPPSTKTSPRRLLCAFSITEDGSGERLPVFADFPAHVCSAAGIAALVEAVAVDGGLEFSDQMKLVAAAAPAPIGDLRRVPKRERPAHRPARDWREDFGKSHLSLGVMAFIYRTLRPRLTQAAARRAILALARARAGKHRLSEDRLNAEGEALKQALR